MECASANKKKYNAMSFAKFICEFVSHGYNTRTFEVVIRNKTHYAVGYDARTAIQ